MDQTMSGEGVISNQRGTGDRSFLQGVTDKVSDGILAAAHKVEDGVAQIEANHNGPLASIAPTISKYGHSVAHALEQSADYVRDVDLEELKDEATEKVKQNPGKAVLIAAGVGFILGALLKKRGL